MSRVDNVTAASLTLREREKNNLTFSIFQIWTRSVGRLTWSACLWSTGPWRRSGWPATPPSMHLSSTETDWTLRTRARRLTALGREDILQIVDRKIGVLSEKFLHKRYEMCILKLSTLVLYVPVFCSMRVFLFRILAKYWAWLQDRGSEDQSDGGAASQQGAAQQVRAGQVQRWEVVSS